MKTTLFNFIFFLVIVCCSCNSNNADDNPPVLSDTVVNLNTVTTFIPFGEDLSAAQKNPAFEYIVDNANVEVVACSDGIIDKILENNGFSDVEIHIKPSINSEWIIIYDHVKSVTLSKGDFVGAGTPLGIVGDGNRTELQINLSNGANTLSYCPLQYGTTEFVSAHIELTSDWCLADSVIP